MAYSNAKPHKINRNDWYNLRALAEIFDCQPTTLREAIKRGELTARKRGKTWVVRGHHALEWWDSD